MPKVTLNLFAVLRETAGAPAVDVVAPEGATLADAWAGACALYPALAAWTPHVRLARNGAYASGDEPLAQGDDLAAIPPVSGG